MAIISQKQSAPLCDYIDERGQGVWESGLEERDIGCGRGPNVRNELSDDGPVPLPFVHHIGGVEECSLEVFALCIICPGRRVARGSAMFQPGDHSYFGVLPEFDGRSQIVQDFDDSLVVEGIGRSFRL